MEQESAMVEFGIDVMILNRMRSMLGEIDTTQDRINEVNEGAWLW